MSLTHTTPDARQAPVSTAVERDLDLGIVTIEATFARNPWGSARMNTATQRTVVTVVTAPRA
jgi:hypothetical protein